MYVSAGVTNVSWIHNDQNFRTAPNGDFTWLVYQIPSDFAGTGQDNSYQNANIATPNVVRFWITPTSYVTRIGTPAAITLNETPVREYDMWVVRQEDGDISYLVGGTWYPMGTGFGPVSVEDNIPIVCGKQDSSQEERIGFRTGIRYLALYDRALTDAQIDRLVEFVSTTRPSTNPVPPSLAQGQYQLTANLQYSRALGVASAYTLQILVMAIDGETGAHNYVGKTSGTLIPGTPLLHTAVYVPANQDVLGKGVPRRIFPSTTFTANTVFDYNVWINIGTGWLQYGITDDGVVTTDYLDTLNIQITLR